jgi:hypothetical protein
MNSIIFYNRETFLTKNYSDVNNEVLVFYWKDGSWGSQDFPLKNGVTFRWVVNYSVKKNIFVKYKDVTLLNVSLGYEGTAELLNIYNNKTISELEKEYDYVILNEKSLIISEIEELKSIRESLQNEINSIKKKKYILEKQEVENMSFYKKLIWLFKK